MKTRIIVDSTADLMPEIKERVHVVPLSVYFGEEEDIDGVTIDHQTFYEKLIESDVLPTTSQANPAVFEEFFAEAVKDGSQVDCVTCASKLSGTYQSAVIAGEGRDYVHPVDTRQVSVGQGAVVAAVAKWLKTPSISKLGRSAISLQISADSSDT